jgi:hypothetical protein
METYTVKDIRDQHHIPDEPVEYFFASMISGWWLTKAS